MSKGIPRGSKALAVLNRFKRVNAILYVEGPTDRVFWKTLLDSKGVNGISIEIAGSCTIIDDYIDKILNEDLEIFVARDKDYKYTLNKLPQHERVLFTFGHSIENTLVYNDAIVSIGKSIGGEEEYCSLSVHHWHEYIINQLQPLVIREFANEAIGSGLNILGDHGDSLFGKTWNSDKFPAERILKKIEEIDKIISPHDIQVATSVVEERCNDIYCYIRGHFLFSLALKFVKEMMITLLNKKSVNVSNDSLMTMLSMAFRGAIDSGMHPHKEHYMTELDKLIIN
ncbi:DUF4435 domain-containing protein [Klebsiella quasivariicola]|uniref:DUF4435 domain-containing protein n=1 Tax=Klebsiella quasivariicola TaxID=2026240 RepID=UPI0024797827|nr:DUF4435 domain-containing protein [Klebsiella quasivariicola]